jgi:hypothetical protein
MMGHPLTKLFYCIQFERNPFGSIDWIVNELVPSGKLKMTASELANAIGATLASGIALKELDLSQSDNIDEETLLAFLSALQQRLVPAGE